MESVKIKRKYLPLIVALAVGCPYTFDLLAAGYYPQMMSILFVLVFCWLLLVSYNDMRNTWFLLSLIYAAVWLTYPYLAVIPIGTMVLVIVLAHAKKLIVPSLGTFLISVLLSFPRPLWLLQRLTFYLSATSPALPIVAILPVGGLGIVGLLSFIYSKRHESFGLTELVVPCLNIAVILQTAGLFLLDSIMNYGQYFFLKSGYLGTFSSLAVAGQIFRGNWLKFRRRPPRIDRRSFLTLLTLSLILANFALAIVADSRIVFEARRLSLNQPLYDAAAWINRNEPNDLPVGCLAPYPGPACLWVIAISNHPPLFNSSASLNVSLSEWLSSPAKKVILLVVVGPDVPSDWSALQSNSSAFSSRILYYESNVFVLKAFQTPT
jgi:hypothetical protein